MKKVIKKTKKPQFVVDLTNVENPVQLYAKFGLAKNEAGLPMLKDELNAIMLVSGLVGAEALGEILSEIPCKSFEIKNGEKLVFDDKGKFMVKKPNIFRRFWNWITRKK